MHVIQPQISVFSWLSKLWLLMNKLSLTERICRRELGWEHPSVKPVLTLWILVCKNTVSLCTTACTWGRPYLPSSSSMLHIRQSFPSKHIYFYHDKVKKKVRVPAKEKSSHYSGRAPTIHFLRPQVWWQPSRHQPLIEYHKDFFLATEGPNHGNQWVGLRSGVFRLSVRELSWANMPQQAYCLKCRIYRRFRFNPWIGKISWKRKWQPTPVSLPGKSHGQRGLVSYSPWDDTESNTVEWLSSCIIRAKSANTRFGKGSYSNYYRLREQSSSRSVWAELHGPPSVRGPYTQHMSSSTAGFLAAILKPLTAFTPKLMSKETGNSRKRCVVSKYVHMAVHSPQLSC